MTSFAALMIIVACHAESSACVREPVAVISYHDSKACRDALPGELVRAKRLTRLVYGDCVPVDPSLLAGREEIRRAMGPGEVSAALSALRAQQSEELIARPSRPNRGLASLVDDH